MNKDLKGAGPAAPGTMFPGSNSTASSADVSGERNPMHGRKGALSPSFIDGRTLDENGNKIVMEAPWRRVKLQGASTAPCEVCGHITSGKRLHVHHRDKDRNNNDPSNLVVVCVTCHNTVFHPQPHDDKGRFMRQGVVSPCASS